MQWHACAPDLFNERFTARLELFQVRRAGWFVSRSRENHICHFQIAYRAIVWCGKRVDLFGYAQRRFSNFIVWSDVAHDRRINRVSENDQRVISNLNGIAGVHKCTWHHDKGIGRAD